MKRRTSSEWDRIIKSWRESGLSQTKYCQLNNLSYWSFRENRLKRETQAGKKKLVKISHSKKIENKEISKQTPDVLLTKKTIPITIILNDGIQLKIPDYFNRETLHNVMEVLGRFQ